MATVERLGRVTAEWVAVITAIVFVVVWLVRIEGRVNGHDLQLHNAGEVQREQRELEAMRFQELRSDLGYIRMRLDAAPSK